VLRGIFVTGTDTGVGKTVAAAALMHRYRTRAPGAESSRLMRYWKPIQTGIGQDDDTATVRELGACREEELFTDGIRLPHPVSPHLAARLKGVTILLPAVAELVSAQPESDRWIVEGAGGVLAPINDSEFMVDLMARLRLPALVVARTTLGTINHTLLTLEALGLRSVRVAGVLLVGDPNAENRAAIEAYGRVPVVGELPRLAPLTPGALERCVTSSLDRDGRLAELFR